MDTLSLDNFYKITKVKFLSNNNDSTRVLVDFPDMVFQELKSVELDRVPNINLNGGKFSFYYMCNIYHQNTYMYMLTRPWISNIWIANIMSETHEGDYLYIAMNPPTAYTIEYYWNLLGSLSAPSIELVNIIMHIINNYEKIQRGMWK